MRLMKLALMSLVLSLPACGKDSPTGPSSTPPATQPPGPVALAGTVTAAAGAGGRISGATVAVLDGANAGRMTTTNASGEYRLENLAQANANVSASATGFLSANLGVFVDGTAQLNFVLQPVLFARSGVGDTVFDMPIYVRRIRIQGFYGGRCENFIVRIARRLIVNVILGNCSVAQGRDFDGTYLTTGGVVEIVGSSGVQWTFTEVR